MNSFLPKFLALVAATFLTATVAFAGAGEDNVTVAWDPNSEEGVGYMVYYGTTSGVYDQQAEANHQTSQMILHLTVGTTYYFAATA